MGESARNTVVIVFEGKAQPLESALKELQGSLADFGAAADVLPCEAPETWSAWLARRERTRR